MYIGDDQDSENEEEEEESDKFIGKKHSKQERIYHNRVSFAPTQVRLTA